MAVQVYQGNAQNKGREDMMAILPIAASVVGGAYGGAGGAAAGGAVGGELAKSQQAPAAPQPLQAGSQTNTQSMSGMPSNAVSRRQQNIMDAQAMQDAQVALSGNPRLQKQFGPVLAGGQQNALQRYQYSGGGSYS